MSLSDFSTAVALVSEGHCPLCGSALERDVRFTARGGSVSIEAHDTHCSTCGIGWSLNFTIEEKPRPMLHTSRPLRSDEIKILYKREQEPS